MSGVSNSSKNKDYVGPLASELQDAQIEWPAKTNSYFIPIDKIKVLENNEKVGEEIRGLFQKMSSDRVDRYVEVICRGATRIFAVILSGPQGIQETIFRFIDEGITDEDLPFVRVFKKPGSPHYTLAGTEHEKCLKEEHPDCGIKAVQSWGRMEVQNLCRDQWLVQAPVFQKVGREIPHYVFNDAVVLPFPEDEENVEGAIKIGGYSEVWAVRIHPAHQTVLKTTDPLV